MIGALLLYAAVSIGIYAVNGPPPPEGYTHDDVCIRCGEDYQWYSNFSGGDAPLEGEPQQIQIVEEGQ